MFARAGASLEGALFWQNFVLMLALVGILHRWALVLTRDRLASLLVPAIVLLSGGFGWVYFLSDAAQSGQGAVALLRKLPRDYTMIGTLGYRWGNAITALLLTQRSWLLGIPLALVVWTLWWKATGGDGETGSEGEAEREKAKGRRQKAKGKSESGEKGGVKPGGKLGS